MDNFTAIYKILKYIEKHMDVQEFDQEHFTAKQFGISDVRFFKLLQALINDGYIAGMSADTLIGGFMTISIGYPALTIKGMEYLEENAMMKKAYRALKGIKEIAPGI